MTNHQKPTITCALGIALMRDVTDTEGRIKALCALKGVEKPEQLSRAELRELTEFSENFNLAVLSPKDVRDVRIEFTLGEYRVVLGRFTELDITVQALEMLEDFNPGDLERMPVMLGCIYAPIVKRMFDLPDEVAQVASDVADAIRDQVPFEDVFAVYDFFVAWKETYLRERTPSFRRSMSNYRISRRVTRPSRMLIRRSLTSSRRRSRKITRVIRGLLFTAAMCGAILSRWFWLAIASWRRWWRTKRRK